MEPFEGADQQEEPFRSEFFNSAFFKDDYGGSYNYNFEDYDSQNGESTCSEMDLLQTNDAAEISDLIDRTLLLDPDYRGPDQENDFPLPALVDPTIDNGDYFDWVNADDTIIDTEHHTLPNKPFSYISSDTQHVQSGRKRPTMTETQDLEYQHSREVDTRKFLTSATNNLTTCMAAALDGFNSLATVNRDNINLTQMTDSSAVCLLEAGQKHSTSIRCIECSFGHAVKCLGFPCKRCVRIYESHKRIAIANDPQLWMSIDTMIFFDIVSTQSLLMALRQETEEVMSFQSLDCLEKSFNAPIICHIESGHSVHGYPRSNIPIAVSELATTRRAASEAYLSRQDLVHPALDKVQLDGFVDMQICKISTLQLQPREVGIITTALRCSAYLSILFNWDKHKIFCGSTSLFKSKNLVLETAYSIAYRIQDLIKLVEYEVRESLRHPKSTSDPATVSCALWILYRSIKSQRKVDWRASSLQSLQEFLNTFHNRIPAALKALERYRAQVAFQGCSQESGHMKEFLSLVNAQTGIDSTISCAFEEHRDTLFNYPASEIYHQGQSYTAILESQVFWNRMEGVTDIRYFYDLIRQIRDQPSDYDTTSSLTHHSVSTLASSVSDKTVLLRDTRSLRGTNLAVNSHQFQSQSSGGLFMTSNSRDFGLHNQENHLMDLNGQSSNPFGPNQARLAPADDPQRNLADLPSPTTVAHPLKDCLGTSMVNQPNRKLATTKGTQTARRKKKDDFRFYNPIKKIFS